MEEFEQEEGVSLLSILKVMFGRKLLLLILTVAIGLIGTLLILFGYNNLKGKYVSSFTYSEPNLAVGKYVDGAAFNYGSLVATNNLYAIKESNNDFSSVNVDKMIKDNSISISREIEETTATSTTETVVTNRTITYTITIDKKYFSSEDQAKKFIQAIVNTTIDENQTKIKYLSYNNAIEFYTNTNILDQKVKYLREQYDFILNKYNNLSTVYNNYIVKSKNKSIAAYISEFKSAFEVSNSIDNLYANMLRNVYVLDYTNMQDEYEELYNTYLTLYTYNDKKINELKTTINDIIQALPDSKKSDIDMSKYNEEIIKATSLKQEYLDMINYYSNVLEKLEPAEPNYIARASEADSQAFLKKLDAAKDKLVEATNVLKEVEAEVLTDNNNVYYSYSNVIDTKGQIKTILAIIISIVAGFVVGCIVNLVLDYRKIGAKEEPKKIENKEEKTTE